MSRGTVYLVGAGPGDPGLITMKGAQCLAAADAVVYDRLVSPALLTHVRPGTRLIYAGKEPGRQSRSQEEINRLLVELALQGKSVCRLKGGDPFLFGRGGEECEALAARGIPFEVVPGVTSGIAAPACAGIPVTHREVARTVTILTGHEAQEQTGERINLPATAAGHGTLLVYMGLAGLRELARALVEQGWAPGTPVAVIHRGSQAEQQTLTGALTSIADQVDQAALTSPVMIVVGEVVSLRPRIAWAEGRPLFGHRVLVPAMAGVKPSSLAGDFRDLGAEVWEWPIPRYDLAAVLREALDSGMIQTVAFPTALSVTVLLSMIGGPEALTGCNVVCGSREAERVAAEAGLTRRQVSA